MPKKACLKLFFSKSPAEVSTPIGAVLELRSHANLLCLVNLADSHERASLSVLKSHLYDLQVLLKKYY